MGRRAHGSRAARRPSGDAGGGHPGPQVQHGLGVDLRHPALAHPEHPADLGERETLVVVQRQDELLPLGQLVDLGPHEVADLAVLDDLRRHDRHLTAQRSRLGPEVERPLERADRRRGDRGQPLPQGVSWDGEVGGDLGVVRRASVRRLEIGDGPLDLPCPRPHRARHPVQLAQAVVDGAADPWRGERLELHRPLRIEALDGVDQPEHARADEIARIHRVRQPGTDATGDELDERGVRDDQMIASRRAAPLEPAIPLHGEVRVDIDDAHALGCASA